ncbi:hypothetical protein GF420_10475 [candidate division GN15 bacterium]|nr:hypothetical protein [candidate division GN15 bacterium]
MSVARLTDEQIQDYLDGNLTGEELRQVERMIAFNPENRRMVEEYQALFGHLEDSAVYSLPPSLEHSVLEQVSMERRQSRWFGHLTVAAVGVFSVAVLVTLAMLIDLRPLVTWFTERALLLPDLSELTTPFYSMIDRLAAFAVEHQTSFALVSVAVGILMLFSSLDSLLLGWRIRRVTGH